jgi:hypothetical protein
MRYGQNGMKVRSRKALADHIIFDLNCMPPVSSQIAWKNNEYDC